MNITNHTPKNVWLSMEPYVVPPVAAGGAIVVALPFLMQKTAVQLGHEVKPVPYAVWMQAARGAAPTTSLLVGGQMVLQKALASAMSDEPGLITTVASSAFTGACSVAPIAALQGKTAMPPLSAMEAVRRLTKRQCALIVLQETAFVGGLGAADLVAQKMEELCGPHPAVPYVAAAVAGAVGSLLGHGANTAWSREQAGLPPLHSVWELRRGALYRVKGVVCFAVTYKLMKDAVHHQTVGL